MKELTANTKIRLSQIRDLWTWRYTQDKHSGAKIGDVRRWKDGRLHEKTTHGWRVLSESGKYNIRTNTKEEKKNKKNHIPARQVTQQEFSKIIDKLFIDTKMRTPEAVKLPQLNRALMKQIGLDRTDTFVFNTRFHHISPARKAEENQLMTKEEYKKIPEVVKNAKFAILDKKSGNFKIVFKDENNPDKYNKLVFGKTNNGNFLVTLGKVDKRNIYDKKTEKIVGTGVAPVI